MAVAVVQTVGAGATSSAGSVTQTLASFAASGNTVLAGYSQANAGVVPDLTASGWDVVFSSVRSTTEASMMVIYANVASGGSDATAKTITVPVQAGTPAHQVVGMIEVSGTAGGVVPDVTANKITQTNVLTWDSGTTPVPSKAKGIAVAVVGAGGSNTGLSAPTNGFTLLAHGNRAGMAYKVFDDVTTPAAKDVTITSTTQRSPNGVIAVFVDAAVANVKPTATFVADDPILFVGDSTSFALGGSDPDGIISARQSEAVTAGAPALSNSTTTTPDTATFTTPGFFTYRGRVQDDDGEWSDWVEATIQASDLMQVWTTGRFGFTGSLDGANVEITFRRKAVPATERGEIRNVSFRLLP